VRLDLQPLGARERPFSQRQQLDLLRGQQRLRLAADVGEGDGRNVQQPFEAPDATAVGSFAGTITPRWVSRRPRPA
jgi:hypothetical protein